jgi:hypothetical protein
VVARAVSFPMDRFFTGGGPVGRVVRFWGVVVCGGFTGRGPSWPGCLVLGCGGLRGARTQRLGDSLLSLRLCMGGRIWPGHCSLRSRRVVTDRTRPSFVQFALDRVRFGRA